MSAPLPAIVVRAEQLADEVQKLRLRVEELEAQKNGAYAERNQVVALLARMAPWMGWNSGIGYHPESDATWEPDWRTIVFVDLPTGQASWHFHISEQHLLQRGLLPSYLGEWDGHSTEEKYRRVNDALTHPCTLANHECSACGRIEQPCRECAGEKSISARHDAEVRAKAIESVIAFIEGGRFLHDQAPTARFAREVVAGIRRQFEVTRG